MAAAGASSSSWLSAGSWTSPSRGGWDRAFRPVLDGVTTLGHLRARGCGLGGLQEHWIDTTTPIGEAMFHVTIALAGLERQTLSERARAGMERAR